MVHRQQTGRPGRPAVVIEQQWLQDALSARRHIPLTSLAKALGVHRNTLYNQMRALVLNRQYSNISDDALDELLKEYKTLKPNSGVRYITGFLRAGGIRVQRKRVHDSLQRIDRLGQILRNHAAIDRRVYTVPHSNYLWHIDGHHKLIRWGLVLHGGADGSDRVVRLVLCLIDMACADALHC